MKNNLPKHIHIIGICGVATSAIAIAFKKAGVRVTGSDKGFFPPVSTELEKYNIPFYAGWHPEEMLKTGIPDLVMIGGTGTSPSNPETVFTREKKIPVYPYAEILQKYFIKKNSIVIAGTWGKTTISSLLSFIMIRAGMDPSYFTGGLSLSHDTGAISNTDWSVVEGDEYQVSISDKRPKFVFYNPTHLLLTSVSWDHADLYPTEKVYFDTFKKLVSDIPSHGTIVVCSDNDGTKQVIDVHDKRLITYGHDKSATFRYDNIIHTHDGLSFKIYYDQAFHAIQSPMLGRYNVENITGAFAMAHSIGIDPKRIITAVREFRGIKRRLEKRFDGDFTVLDCHAPTPEKAMSVLQSIKEVYHNKIIAVFEPNIGGRKREIAEKYNNAFQDADTIIIPRLTKLKVSENDNDKPIEGDELTAIISKTHKNALYQDDDNMLITYLKSLTKKGDVIAFLGSHGFRGMIEELIKS